jgi:hypothetical protein
MKIKTTHSNPTASDVTLPNPPRTIMNPRNQQEAPKEPEASDSEVPPRDHQQRHPASPPARTENSPESPGKAPPPPSCQ